jgi:hypothetical protein
MSARAFNGCTILGLSCIGVCCAASAQMTGTTMASAAPQPAILGFSPAHAIVERGLESQFQSLPSCRSPARVAGRAAHYLPVHRRCGSRGLGERGARVLR